MAHGGYASEHGIPLQNNLGEIPGDAVVTGKLQFQGMAIEEIQPDPAEQPVPDMLRKQRWIYIVFSAERPLATAEQRPLFMQIVFGLDITTE